MKACHVEPLTVPLTKVLECGHERSDFDPVKLGRSLHCWMCHGLKDVVDVFVPSTVTLNRFNRDRLVLAGYTEDEVRQMVSKVGRR